MLKKKKTLNHSYLAHPWGRPLCSWALAELSRRCAPSAGGWWRADGAWPTNSSPGWGAPSHAWKQTAHKNTLYNDEESLFASILDIFGVNVLVAVALFHSNNNLASYILVLNADGLSHSNHKRPQSTVHHYRKLHVLLLISCFTICKHLCITIWKNSSKQVWKKRLNTKYIFYFLNKGMSVYFYENKKYLIPACSWVDDFCWRLGFDCNHL